MSGNSRVIIGDCREVLLTLEAGSVQTCVTSPPYWGLRDYGHDGQIGLESTPQEYVEKMVAVFREVRRVLRDDGTLWLNLGDSYSNDTKWGGSSGGKNQHSADGGYQGQRVRRNGDCDPKRGSAAPGQPYQQFPSGLKPKDLVGIPWRVAFALQADGWYLRQDIIWAKPNPMPESVRDRCTKAHEYLFLLAKSEKYYCDMEAIKEESITGDPRKPYAPGQVDYRGNGHDRNGGKPRSAGNKSHKLVTEYERSDSEEHRTAAGLMKIAAVPWESRNKRSVWTVATQPYSEAHFATFPPGLIEPCVLAGSRPGDTVLDPFGGSGTTGQVAEALGRKWLLIELNGEYEKLCADRTRQTGMVLL